jgi:glutaredoxin
MQIILYTRPGCSQCIKAKAFLASQNISYKEFTVDVDITVAELKEQYPGVASLPVVIMDGVLIGGTDQLMVRINDTK